MVLVLMCEGRLFIAVTVLVLMCEGRLFIAVTAAANGSGADV